MHEFSFDPVAMPAGAEALRSEVRTCIAVEVAKGAFTPGRNSWSSFDPEFSRKCGERGYIGMRWPKQYGGRERSALERTLEYSLLHANERVQFGRPIAKFQAIQHMLAQLAGQVAAASAAVSDP